MRPRYRTLVLYACFERDCFRIDALESLARLRRSGLMRECRSFTRTSRLIGFRFGAGCGEAIAVVERLVVGHDERRHLIALAI
jgi:hypothetical protein